MLESLMYLLNSRPVSLSRTKTGQIRLISINDIKFAYTQFSALQGETGMFAGKPQYKDFIEHMECLTLSLRKEIFPTVLEFLYNKQTFRDRKKFSKRSTPASKLKPGDLVFF